MQNHSSEVPASQYDSTDEISETASVISLPHSSNTSLALDTSNSATKDTTHFTSLASRGDINTAAALRAQYAIETPRPTRRRHRKTTTHIINDDAPDEAPVIDQTASLTLHSKKTERLQRRQKKQIEKRLYQQSITTTLLTLPTEIQTEIFTYLLPTDIASLRCTSHTLNNITKAHESIIARTIIRRRYWNLHRCFPLPIPFASIPEDTHDALLNPKRQEMLNIHRKSYHQHVQMIDPTQSCTCMTCVFAWNNLCLIVDLHHWQPCLENREPIPIIPRGTSPSWNQFLLDRNASLVRTAMSFPIMYARILQMHLDTTITTIQRNARWRRKLPATAGNISIPIGAATAAAAMTTLKMSKPRLYHLSDADVASQTDAFLDRSGPPSYDFPYMRDNYYGLEAYVPNRKWSSEEKRWCYYAPAPAMHERDLDWVRSWVRNVERRDAAAGKEGGGEDAGVVTAPGESK